MFDLTEVIYSRGSFWWELIGWKLKCYECNRKSLFKLAWFGYFVVTWLRLLMGLYRYFSLSQKSAIFISTNIFGLIVLLISLVIIASVEFHWHTHSSMNIIFWKHDFNYNCEMVKSCFNLFAIIIEIVNTISAMCHVHIVCNYRYSF